MSVETKVDWNGDEFKRHLRRNLADAVARSGVIMQRRMKTELSHAGKGRMHPGNVVTSSAPGDPPVAQTGHLRQSVQIDPASGVSKKGELVSVRVGTNLPYGRYLEYGTTYKGPITAKNKKVLAARVSGDTYVVFGKQVQHPGVKPRPWARPSLAKASKKVQQQFSFEKLARGFRG